MTAWRFVVCSLRYHWRINLAVALGVAAATAVLTGALLVGDSVRGSLRQLTLERLGLIEQVLVADRYFRVQLADELAASPGFDESFAGVQAVLLFPSATVERMGEPGQPATERAAGVLVVGSTPQFWQLGTAEGRPRVPPGEQEIVLNQPLAEELRASVGDLVALRLPKATEVHAESVLGDKQDRIRGITQLRVIEIIPARGLGRFSLQPRQTTPRNAFVSLRTLQEPLELDEVGEPGDASEPGSAGGKANCLLVAGKSLDGRFDPRADQRLADWFRPRLQDYGFRLKHVRQTFPGETDQQAVAETIFDYYSLSTDQLLFTPEAERVAAAAYGPLGGQPLLTYLANAIGKVPAADAAAPPEAAPEAPPEIPYSMIAAVNEATAAELLRDEQGRPIPLDDQSLVLNSWAADKLEAQVGDTIRVTYFEPETTHGQYVERTADFTLSGIVRLTEPDKPFSGNRRNPRPPVYGTTPTMVNDPDLTPEVDGVTDQDSIESWDVPFPMTRSLRPVDDQYWKNHRTTPKAFVSLARGQQLWGTPRFGQVTSFRIPAAGGVSADELADRFVEQVRQQGSHLGLTFQPLKRQALEASAGTTPFDGLFLGLSLFIIAAALMLVALLFRLGVEQRAREVGILLAVGLARRQVAGLWVLEGLLVAALGGVLGVAAGVGYSWLMLAGLQSWWVGAIVTPFLQFHWQPSTLLIGYVLGVLVSAVTIAWTVGQLRRVSTRRLLGGQAQESGGLVHRRQPLVWLAALGLLLAALALGTAALFAGGETQAGCFVGAGASLLTSLLLVIWGRLRGGSRGTASVGGLVSLKLAMRSAARNPARSTLTIGLIAFASFLIVAMSSFQLAPTTSGVGGFNLVAESGQPVFDDLATPAGRARLLGNEAEQSPDVTILPLRLQPGDDASCNNLYRPSQPRVLGVGPAMMAYFDNAEVPHFAWAATDARDDREGANPWRLLDRPLEDGAIPVILDKDTAMWSLRLYWGVGETFQVTYDDGTQLTFRVVGLLSKSVLQGNLLIGERHFVERFPRVAGYRYFLVRSPADEEPRVVSLLESRLRDEGFDAMSSYRLLESLLAVQNTYLRTFRSLGALGLLLGTFGLATVQLRGVLERRGELALLRTTGFRRRRLAGLVLLENLLLLLGGLGTGVLAALVAVLPHMLLGAASIPASLLVELAATLALVLVVGLVTGMAAVRATLRAPLLEALRQD
ncbi:MAG: ABC transporter permease [Pirellulaceae bacterium]|nr:ABC transporter permease [Pirellulaceae bacterium]